MSTISISSSYYSGEYVAASQVEFEELTCRWKFDVSPYLPSFQSDTPPPDHESPVIMGKDKLQPSWQLRWKRKLSLRGNIYFIVEVMLHSEGVVGSISTNASASTSDNNNAVRATAFVSFKEPLSKTRKEIEMQYDNVNFGTLNAGGKVNLVCEDHARIFPSDLEDETKGFVAKNILTIYATILVSSTKLNSTKCFLDHRQNDGAEKQLNYFLSTMKKLFLNDKEFYDVVLITETKVFPAHKAILAAKSSVFAAMFRSNMLESKKNSITIHDFDKDVVGGMLEFMYTGECSKLPTKAVELLQIGDKYELLELKTEAEEYLSQNLQICSVVAVWQIASLLNSVDLKKAAEVYIARNRKELKKLDSFKELAKTNPEVIIELF